MIASYPAWPVWPLSGILPRSRRQLLGATACVCDWGRISPTRLSSYLQTEEKEAFCISKRTKTQPKTVGVCMREKQVTLQCLAVVPPQERVCIKKRNMQISFSVIHLSFIFTMGLFRNDKDFIGLDKNGSAADMCGLCASNRNGSLLTFS